MRLDELLKQINESLKQKPLTTVYCEAKNGYAFQIISSKYDPNEDAIVLTITDDPED